MCSAPARAPGPRRPSLPCRLRGSAPGLARRLPPRAPQAAPARRPPTSAPKFCARARAAAHVRGASGSRTMRPRYGPRGRRGSNRDRPRSPRPAPMIVELRRRDAVRGRLVEAEDRGRRAGRSRDPSAASTNTSRQPMRFSHAPVISARASNGSASTMRAPSVPAYWSVAWTSCPPGAETAPGRCPASYSAGSRTSKR